MSINNLHSGVLLQKPGRSIGSTTSFETHLMETFFIGRDQPITDDPAFNKYVKEEYDQEKVDVEIDLMAGASNVFLCKPSNLNFPDMLDYLRIQKENNPNKSLKELVYNSNIVARRGLLNKLLNCPFTNNKFQFAFAIKKFDGIYFFKELTPENANQTPGSIVHLFLPLLKDRIMQPYGDQYYEQPRNIATTWEQMQGVFVANLYSNAYKDGLKIFYGSELDAFDNADNVLEIKLQKIPKGQVDAEFNPDTPFLADRLRRWYFQSLLVQCEKLLVGFRQDKLLTTIKKINIDSLNGMVREEDRWNSKSGFTACYEILSTILQCYEDIVREKETLVIELSADQKDIQFFIRDDKIHKVLPESFIKAFEDPITPAAANGEEPVIENENKEEEAWLENIVEKSLKIED